MIPLPPKPKVILEKGNRGVFEIENLYPGYGQTIGNSLRRVLLSSLSGAAITTVKIEGVEHEFSTIEGVLEDVVEIMLNLKQMRFKLTEQGPFTATLSEKGEKVVTGKDFKVPSQVEIVTPDLPIATLTSKNSKLNMEVLIESGLGYVPAEVHSKEKVEIGTIALDAVFTPVRHVNYEVENMRVGDRTDYNRLRIHIETDGTITPYEAFERAANILIEQFQALVGQKDIEKNKGAVLKAKEKYPIQKEEDKKQREDLTKLKLDELDISSRTVNILREANIKTVGGLIRKKEETLRGIGGLGDKAIEEIKKGLEKIGLELKE